VFGDDVYVQLTSSIFTPVQYSTMYHGIKYIKLYTVTCNHIYTMQAVT